MVVVSRGVLRWRFGVVQARPVRYTLFNDRSDRCTTRPQRALSLRLGPQIQALLSREGRRKGECRTGQSRSGSACSIVRGRHRDAQTGAKVTNGPALEGDLYSWLRPAPADATQGRWQLRSRAKVVENRAEPVMLPVAEVSPFPRKPSPTGDSDRPSQWEFS